MYYDVVHTLVPNVIYPKTGLGSEYLKQVQINHRVQEIVIQANASQTIVLNDNNFMTTSGIVASQINETNEYGFCKII